MIDTIKFRFFIKNLKNERLNSLELFQLGQLIFKKHTKQIRAGSYSYDINFHIFDDKCEIEYSVPKLIYGYNVEDDAVGHEEVYLSAMKLYGVLNGDYFDCPHPDSWTIERIDYCDNFQVDRPQQSIDNLSQIEYPKKKRLTFPTSVMWVGSTYSLKFYLKNPEFMKHDFKRISLIDGHKASMLAHKCDNTLRFEITIRKRGLKYFFSTDKLTLAEFMSEPIGNGKILELLKWAKNQKGLEQLQKDSLREILVSVYGKNKGGKLYAFYEQYHTTSGKHKLETFMSRATMFRYLRDIKNGIAQFFPDLDKLVDSLPVSEK